MISRPLRSGPAKITSQNYRCLAYNPLLTIPPISFRGYRIAHHHGLGPNFGATRGVGPKPGRAFSRSRQPRACGPVAWLDQARGQLSPRLPASATGYRLGRNDTSNTKIIRKVNKKDQISTKQPKAYTHITIVTLTR